MQLLDEAYPERNFPTREDDPKREPKARIVSLLRTIDKIRSTL